MQHRQRHKSGDRNSCRKYRERHASFGTRSGRFACCVTVCKSTIEIMPPGIMPATILRNAYGIYRSAAMLAGMQLDLFTPLKNGPMSAATLANALSLRADKLRPLLYALVDAELLTLVEDDHFANTPEAEV